MRLLRTKLLLCCCLALTLVHFHQSPAEAFLFGGGGGTTCCCCGGGRGTNIYVLKHIVLKFIEAFLHRYVKCRRSPNEFYNNIFKRF
jgi:hypothetical protein